MAQRHKVRGYGLPCIVREMGTLSQVWESTKRRAGTSYNPAAHLKQFYYSHLPCAPLLFCVQILPYFVKTWSKENPWKVSILFFFKKKWFFSESALICAPFACEYSLLMILLLHLPSFLFCFLTWENQGPFDKVWSCSGLSIICHLILWSLWLIICVGEAESSALCKLLRGKKPNTSSICYSFPSQCLGC